MTVTAGMPLVEIANVSVRFGGVTALQDVSFEVTEGALHAIIGPNGAGKSTMLNVLSGIIRPQHGSVHVRGVDLARKRAHDMPDVGIARAFQNIALFPEMSVEDNLLVARHRLLRSGFLSGSLRLPGALREESRHRARVREMAATLGLADLLSKAPHELSYGDQKRVELARALCMETPLVLLDEPLAGMNSGEKARVADSIRLCHEQLDTTVILVDHDMPFVMDLAQTITVLDFGQTVAQGTPAEVCNHPDVISAYLGQPDNRSSKANTS